MEGTAPSKPADTMCRWVEGKPAQIRSRAGVVDRLGNENIVFTQSYLAAVLAEAWRSAHGGLIGVAGCAAGLALVLLGCTGTSPVSASSMLRCSVEGVAHELLTACAVALLLSADIACTIVALARANMRAARAIAGASFTACAVASLMIVDGARATVVLAGVTMGALITACAVVVLATSEVVRAIPRAGCIITGTLFAVCTVVARAGARPSMIVSVAHRVLCTAAVVALLLSVDIVCGFAALIRGANSFTVRFRGAVVSAVVVMYLSPTVGAVCPHCRGRFDPPGHTADACPTIAVVAANAATVVAGTYVFTKLEKVLPSYILRLFPTAAVKALTSILLRPDPGAPFSFEGKDIGQIVRAYRAGLVSKDDVLEHYAVVSAAATEATEIAAADRAVSLVKGLSDVQCAECVGDVEGAYRYVLARVSLYATSKFSDSVVMDLARDVKSGASSSSSSSSVTAKNVLPRAEHEFFEMLNLWSMVVHASGLANFLVVGTFLQDTVYHPMRRDGLSWQGAYCRLHQYLAEVEESTETTLANVHERGKNSCINERAANMCADLFGARGKSARDPGNNSATHGKKEWNNKFDATSKIPCKYFNSGKPHPPENLAADGSCRFNHVCNNFIQPPGGGRKVHCGRAHPAFRCDHEHAASQS